MVLDAKYLLDGVLDGVVIHHPGSTDVSLRRIASDKRVVLGRTYLYGSTTVSSMDCHEWPGLVGVNVSARQG